MLQSIAVGLSWFLSSALLSTWANTTFLRFFEDPTLHTFVRFVGSAILGVLIMLLSGEVKSFDQIVKTSRSMFVF